MAEVVKMCAAPVNLTHRAERLRRIEKLARLLDKRWRVPGTKWFIGLDGLIGLIPGIGDMIGAVLSTWIIAEAHRLGAPWYLVLRMIGNMLVDWLVGLVPLAGDVFDIAWHANEKNVLLLLECMRKRVR